MKIYLNSLKRQYQLSVLNLLFLISKKVEYYNSLCELGEKVKILFAVGDDVNDIVYSATVMEIVSGRDAVACPDDLAYVPCEFADEEKAKIWIKITDIQEENQLKAAMFKVRSTDANLKQVISNSQFHFGYVYLQENWGGIMTEEEKDKEVYERYKRYQRAKWKYESKGTTMVLVVVIAIMVYMAWKLGLI